MKIIVEPVFMFKPYHQQRHRQPVDVMLQMSQLQHYLHLISASSHQINSNRFLLTLSFANDHFRKRYLSAIYAEYSRSQANRQMIRHNEHAVLMKWARKFNHARHQFKIVQIHPIINRDHYSASCLVLSLNSSLEGLFDPAFFYKFASTETRQLVKIMQIIFNRCVPGMVFQFRGRSLSYLQASDIIDNMRSQSSRSRTVHSAHHDTRVKTSSFISSEALSNVNKLTQSISNTGSRFRSSRSSVHSQSSAVLVPFSKAMPVASWQNSMSKQPHRSVRSSFVNSLLLMSSSSALASNQQSLRSTENSLRKSSLSRSAALSASYVSSNNVAQQLRIHSSKTAIVANYYLKPRSVKSRSVFWFIGCVIVTFFVMILLFFI